MISNVIGVLYFAFHSTIRRSEDRRNNIHQLFKLAAILTVSFMNLLTAIINRANAVSYTHLDVYKRQFWVCTKEKHNSKVYQNKELHLGTPKA